MAEIYKWNYVTGLGKTITELLSNSNQAQQIIPNISFRSITNYEQPVQISIIIYSWCFNQAEF